MRQTRAVPVLAAFKAWAEVQRRRLSSKTTLGRALQYGLSRFQSCLARLYPDEGGFPALLELCGDQPIVRIASRVAPFRKRSFIARLPKLQLIMRCCSPRLSMCLRSAYSAASIAIGSTATTRAWTRPQSSSR